MKFLFAIAAILAPLAAQSPIRVAYACPEEDVRAFGLDCSEDEPCPVFLELVSAAMAGSRLFVAGNLHTATTTLYGVLLLSEDGGVNWKEPHPPPRAAALDQIQFIDDEYGWVSGAVLDPLPRDPFLWITTDGGKSWKEQRLFDDMTFGSIGQFHFESRTNGQLVLERPPGAEHPHELLETKTGGQTWSSKQISSSPIRLNQSRSPEGDLRLRADAGSKTYHLEKHAGEKWESVASFLIHPLDCK